MKSIYILALTATIILVLLKLSGFIDFGWGFITCPLWATVLIEFLLKLILELIDE